LIEVDFDYGSFIIYEYDGNGNLVSKTPGGSASQSYTIMASVASGSGMVSPSEPPGIRVVSGSNYTFTIIPDTGSCITKVMVDGSQTGSPESYTFTNVQANHSISATFAACTFPITVTVNGSGTVSPGSANVACGGSQTFTITPNTDVYVDGYYPGEHRKRHHLQRHRSPFINGQLSNLDLHHLHLHHVDVRIGLDVLSSRFSSIYLTHVTVWPSRENPI
jgi:hypothetical protein